MCMTGEIVFIMCREYTILNYDVSRCTAFDRFFIKLLGWVHVKL